MNPAPPPIPFPRAVRMMHFALVGALLLAAVAFVVLLRVQGRPFGAAPNVGMFLAGVAIGRLSLVGYVFTGGLAPAVLSILTLVVFRPSSLEREAT